VECPSCGTTDQHKARCEACGFAFPQAAALSSDAALSLFLGLVCSTCDTYNDPGTSVCVSCGAALEAEPAYEPSSPVPVAASVPVPVAAAPMVSGGSGPVPAAPPSWMTPPTGQPLSTAFAMKKVDLAHLSDVPTALAEPITSPSPLPSPSPSPLPLPPTAPPRVATAPVVRPPCWRCSAVVEPNDKFCRQCGARVDAPEKPDGKQGLPTVAVSGAASTQVIGALKLPSLAPATLSSTSTMVMPAMKLAASAGAPGAEASGYGSGGPTATMVFGAANVERVAKLILVRGHSQFGSQWRLQAGETVIGRSSGMVLFPDDDALAARHARLVWQGVDLMVEPEATTNGVFLRLRSPVRLQPGDEFLVGAQRMRVLADSDRQTVIDVHDDGTRLLGSVLKPNPPISLLRITSDERFNEVFFRAQRLLTMGRTHCDLNFDDGFVSERHAQLTHEGTHLTLEDLGSRNGTYVRTRTATKLAHGDLLLLGDQVLRIELPQR
jgi:pSer/pThr/pTyr-binding forkhead associated (FHA) protein